MSLSNRILPTLGLLLLCAPLAYAQTKVAQIKAYCLSFNVQGAVSSTTGFGFKFSTFSGTATQPWSDPVSGSKFRLSDEWSPRPGSAGEFQFGFFGTAGSDFDLSHSYGWGDFTYPINDTDANQVPDWLQVDMPGNATLTGKFVLVSPTAQTINYLGTFSRTAGSTIGNYQLKTQPGNAPTYAGNFIVINGSGTLTYQRGAASSGTLQLSFPLPNGTGTSHGTGSILVDGTDQIRLLNFPLTTQDNLPQTITSATLVRTGNRYVGHLEFNDGLLTTSWRDYHQWVFEVSDPNDSDGNGIPDLSDTLKQPPSIVQQPASISVSDGASVGLAVRAVGSGALAYQWSKDGKPISGATGATYAISRATLVDSGVYTVAVNNGVGTVGSDGALLTVNPASSFSYFRRTYDFSVPTIDPLISPTIFGKASSNLTFSISGGQLEMRRSKHLVGASNAEYIYTSYQLVGDFEVWTTASRVSTNPTAGLGVSDGKIGVLVFFDSGGVIRANSQWTDQGVSYLENSVSDSTKSVLFRIRRSGDLIRLEYDSGQGLRMLQQRVIAGIGQKPLNVGFNMYSRDGVADPQTAAFDNLFVESAGVGGLDLSQGSAIPTLTIQPAVALQFPTTQGSNYQLQFTDRNDPGSWFNLGTPFAGSGANQTLFQLTDQQAVRSFRVLRLP